MRTDVAVRDGSVSVGTAGKLMVAHAATTPGLRSTLTGSVVFESRGERNRDAERAIRKGSVQWALSSSRGYRGELGLGGDSSSRSIRGTIGAPLPGAVQLDAFGESRWTRTDGGGECVSYGNAAVRRQLTRTLVVQPGFHVVDVRAREDLRWFGTNLRIEYRGAELSVNHEGARGSRFATRKTWGAARTRLTLGGQLYRHPTLADRGLLELGLARDRLGFSLYPGAEQQGVLLLAGPFQIGFSQRPTQHQIVLGFDDFSISFLEHDNGATDVGFGFVFNGFARQVSRSGQGWQWQHALPKSALADPHQRWPGLGSLD